MKEYIEREALLNKLTVIKESKNWDAQSEYVMWGIERFINSVPAADVVERKRGEWVRDNPTLVHCSMCKVARNAFFGVGGNEWNFCPNCGADMRSHHDSLCDQTEEVEA